MKKIFIIQTLLLLIFLAGCSDSDYKDFKDSQLKIESSDINFTAIGGTGEIVVAENETFTATSDQDWCSLNVNGKIISITVTPNPSLSGRTARITVKSNNKVNYISVTQTSASLNIETDKAYFLRSGGEVRIAYETETTLSIDNVADSWITASIDGNEIVLQATSNMNFSERFTTVALAIKNDGTTVFTYNINVSQEKNLLQYEDFLGTYTMTYYKTDVLPAQSYTLTVTLSELSAGQTYKLNGLLADDTKDIIVNYSNGVSILAQILFPYSIYTIIFTPYSGAYVTTSSTVGMKSSNADISSGKLKFDLVDNGVWGSYTTIGFALAAYNTSSGSLAGTINLGKDGGSFYCYPSFEKQ
jgi:hypothetical protein